jgi:two-component system, chemotaxis family, sensor kinase CheA
MLQVVVVQKGKQFFGLEVDEILDSLSINLAVDHSLSDSKGIRGHLATEEGVIVVVDVDYVTMKESFSSTSDPTASVVQPNRKNFRILFAEDIVFVRKHVTGQLERLGYQVVQVNDGEEAFEALRSSEKEPFHLVISDIEMPKLNGFQLATKIRQDSRWLNLPIVALTSKTDPEFVKKGMKAGFTLYLEKENSDDLIRFVDRVATSLGEKA